MKAENGRFRVKTAPNAAPSPSPLKTPEMEAANRVKAIGGNPGILSGSISLPLAGPSHQKGVHQNEPVRTLGPLGFYGCIAIMSSNDV